MRVLLFFCFTLLNVFCFSQKLIIDEAFIVNQDLVDKNDSTYSKINLSQNEINLIHQCFNNHLENKLKFYEGWIFASDIVNNTKEDITSSMFYSKSITSSNEFYRNDSIKFEYYTNRIDENGEVLYDEYGDEIMDLKYTYQSFNNSICNINSKTEWEYKERRFTKTTILNGIDFMYISSLSKSKLRKSYFSNSKSSSNQIIFKKNVKYTHYFYPDYYKTFLNNDTIFNNIYSDKIEKGFKADAINNEFEVVKFLEVLIGEIRTNKLQLLKIDSNQQILSEHIKAKNIDELFVIEETQKLDENGDPWYDNEGDPIFITTKDPIFPSDILGIEFYENWSLRKDNFQLTKIVKGIVLIIGDFDKNYVLRGYKKIPAYISFE